MHQKVVTRKWASWLEPHLPELRAELEEQRDHVVRISGPASEDLDALEPLEDRVDEPLGEGEFTPLAAEAAFGHLLHAGRAITAPVGSPDAEDDYLGLPGLLTPEQTAALLASRDVEDEAVESVNVRSDHEPRDGSRRVRSR